jgi:hypothetical protein
MNKTVLVGFAILAVSTSAASAWTHQSYRNGYRTHHSSASRAARAAPREAMNNRTYHNGLRRRTSPEPQTAQQQAAPSEQTKEQMHSDVDKGYKTSEPNEQMQRDADKGAKTRNSGESGYVADQDKPGATARRPGRPEK